MNSSTATLEVAADLAETIKANAVARRQSLDEYLREMIEADKAETSEVPDAQTTETVPTPNYAMLEILKKISELNKDRPYTSGEDTQRILREARAGAMFGYEPTE
ncbi:MAG TPA: hypothetical protein VGB07_15485 [Blastocatellia bacterium]|jgi:plasmid replication initiation protein